MLLFFFKANVLYIFFCLVFSGEPSQPLQACPDSGALDLNPAQSATSPNVEKVALDAPQSSSQSQTHLQPQCSSQSFPCPQTAPESQTQPYAPCYSQSQQISQLQSQTQIQLLSQTNSQPYLQMPPQQPLLSQMQIRSKSTSSGSSSPRASSPDPSCSWARGASRPPSVLLPRALYNVITASDSSGLPRCTSFLPHMSVAWASSFR